MLFCNRIMFCILFCRQHHLMEERFLDFTNCSLLVSTGFKPLSWWHFHMSLKHFIFNKATKYFCSLQSRPLEQDELLCWKNKFMEVRKFWIVLLYSLDAKESICGDLCKKRYIYFWESKYSPWRWNINLWIIEKSWGKRRVRERSGSKLLCYCCFEFSISRSLPEVLIIVCKCMSKYRSVTWNM